MRMLTWNVTPPPAAPAQTNGAQEQNTVDPEVRQQIEAVHKKFDDAFSKRDAAALAALYTQDAIEVWPWEEKGGAASGQEAIEKRWAVELASSPGSETGPEPY